MSDSVIGVIVKAGSLPLRELFARVGADQSTRLQLARLFKDGAVRFESVDEDSAQTGVLEFDAVAMDELQLATRLQSIAQSAVGETVEIVPTAKTWRSPFSIA